CASGTPGIDIFIFDHW
nr:immunoglobulin heavy chain junction region [Macaca mulatta]MOW84370.1 immunoglobulin heavy chain junction region [Macaca mulatta]